MYLNKRVQELKINNSLRLFSYCANGQVSEIKWDVIFISSKLLSDLKDKRIIWLLIFVLYISVDIYGVTKPKDDYIFFMWFSGLTVFFGINVILFVFLAITFFKWFFPNKLLLGKIVKFLVSVLSIFTILLYLLWAILNPVRTYIVTDWKNNISLRVITKIGFLDDDISVYRKKYLLAYKKTDGQIYGVKGTELKQDREALKNHNYRFDTSKGIIILGSGSVYSIK